MQTARRHTTFYDMMCSPSLFHRNSHQPRSLRTCEICSIIVAAPRGGSRDKNAGTIPAETNVNYGSFGLNSGRRTPKLANVYQFGPKSGEFRPNSAISSPIAAIFGGQQFWRPAPRNDFKHDAQVGENWPSICSRRPLRGAAAFFSIQLLKIKWGWCASFVAVYLIAALSCLAAFASSAAQSRVAHKLKESASSKVKGRRGAPGPDGVTYSKMENMPLPIVTRLVTTMQHRLRREETEEDPLDYASVTFIAKKNIPPLQPIGAPLRLQIISRKCSSLHA